MTTETTEPDVQHLSLVLPLFLKDKAKYKQVTNSIKLVRSAARQVYAVLFASQAAGADMKWKDEQLSVIPNNDRARSIMAAVFEKDGKAPIYQAREYVLKHLLPGYHSYVWDSLRADVWTKWTAKDPEFTKATNGYLVLNGIRRLAIFKGLGIGIPAAVSPKLEDHEITLKWSHEIGPVAFSLGTMDPGRWYTWKRIVSGQFPHGTMRLTERDGKLLAIVTYSRPVSKSATMDPDRTLTVIRSANQENLLVIGPEREKTYVAMSLIEARDWSLRLRAQSQVWSNRQRACGSPRRGWGMKSAHKGIQTHRDAITKQRENGCKCRNHSWSKRIVDLAEYWRCGVIEFCDPADSQLGGEPWGWADLLSKIKYKSNLISTKVVAISVDVYRDRQRAIAQQTAAAEFELNLLATISRVADATEKKAA
jgi:hypothetical protein